MEETPFEKMPEPPHTGSASSGSAKQSITNVDTSDLEVYFAPLAMDAETRGITDSLKLSLADFSERIIQCMERFNEKYAWEIEVNGEIKVYGVFSGSAKLKISPRVK